VIDVALTGNSLGNVVKAGKHSATAVSADGDFGDHIRRQSGANGIEQSFDTEMSLARTALIINDSHGEVAVL